MGKFGKFLMGTAALGAAAYGAYYYLRKEEVITPVSDEDEDGYFNEDLDGEPTKARSYVNLTFDKEKAKDLANDKYKKAKESIQNSVQKVEDFFSEDNDTTVGDLVGGVRDKASSVVDAAKEKASDVVADVKAKASEFNENTTDTVKEAADDARDTVQDIVKEVEDTVVETKEAAADQADAAEDVFTETVSEAKSTLSGTTEEFF